MSLVWSYSSLKTFQQCPKKYYHLRVAKDIKQSDTEHTIYGKEMHTAAEEYIKNNKPLPPQFLYLTELLEPLNKIPGEKLCEVKLGIAKVNNRYQPCDFFAKNVWWRGVADLLIINGDTAYSIDYKTSKNAKYADTLQLDLVAAAIFQHYPEVTRVKSALAYVVSKDFIKKDHEKTFKTVYLEKVKFDLERIETATATGVWNAVSGPLCGWCPVKTCHNYREKR
jgi:CRISPR/Cas system-associated exonuclease Cas4 (RecB family)